MSRLPSRSCVALTLLVPLLALMPARAADEKNWIELTDLASWRKPDNLWMRADSVGVDPNNPRLLTARQTVLVNGPKGRARDLLSKREFGDVEVHLEFLIPQRSNSGIKLQGLYEIQICDSWGVKQPKGSDCGGIYPRAELKPSYHYLDKGVPPRTNACKRPGEWQTLDIVFQAPRFDADGKKTANARFVRVVLNGELIHDNVEAATPTGHAWTKKESALAPLLLQGDHGPVAFRKVQARPSALPAK